jgi:hypothetical protein
MINRGITLEARRDVVLDAVDAADLGQQFRHEARDATDALDRALLALVNRVLRVLSGGSNLTVLLTFTITRRARS